MCEELQTLRHNAAQVFREARKIRRSRDLSFYEDAELSHQKRKSIDAVLKHLLVGHQGQPCPGGNRPIVDSAGKTLRGMRAPGPYSNIRGVVFTAVRKLFPEPSRAQSAPGAATRAVNT